MALEIERKFLVRPDRLPPLPAGERLVQGYLSADPEVRFRISPGRVVLCVKKRLADGIRHEFEFPRTDLAPDEIETLRRIALWPPLVKTRHRIPFGGLVWELDIYEEANRGLLTAEVELPAIDHPVAFPDWVDSGSEITGRPEYANINLTKTPLGN